MSLLADLLSKMNNSDRTTDKEIPPTLAMSQGASARSAAPGKRTLILIAVSLGVIASGVITVTRYDSLIALINPKPAAPPKLAETVKAVPPPAPQPVPVVPPPAPPPLAEPQKIESETPASPPMPATDTKPAGRHAKLQKHKTVHALPVKRLKPVVPNPLPPKPRQEKPEPAPEIPLPSKIDYAARDSFLYSARSAEMAGDWRTALASYRKALRIDPENFKIMNNIAAALNNLGMFDEGVQEAKRALGKKPDYVPAMINAAIAYSSAGNSLEALMLFSKASSADPTNRTLAINLGILQERTGKLDEAQHTYRPLAEAGDPLALHGMARIYERKGNRIEAVRAYRQIMSLPNAGSALKKEAKNRISRLEE